MSDAEHWKALWRDSLAEASEAMRERDTLLAESEDTAALVRNAQEDTAALASDILSELTGPNDQYLRDRLLTRTAKIEDSLRKALL